MKNTIQINLEDVLERIYAESAWRTAHRNDLYTLTPDNARMLCVKVSQGFNALLPRMAGWLCASNFNPNIERNNISLTLSLDDTVNVAALRAAIVEALASYALLQFYGERDTHYGIAWRKHRAHVVLLLCRPGHHPAA